MFIACNNSTYILRRRLAKCVLIIFWCSGIVFGFSAADAAGSLFVSLMRRCLFVPVSIVGILLRSFFFLLITALAVSVSKPLLFLPAALIRAFCLSYFLRGLVLTWQLDAWLIVLLCFASFLSACSLLWFWFRHFPIFSVSVKRDIFVCFLLQLVLNMVEYFLTASLMMSLLD